MVSRRLATLAAAATIMVGGGLVSRAAVADETGLASMHAWVKVRGATCYADHTHYASSVGHKDKKTAMAAAVKSWVEFTAWEYGTAWANFNKAVAKKADCKQSSSGWSCDVEARPCRAAGRR